MIQPRSYQTECVNSLWNYFKHNKGNPVAALPTGTGKSVIIALFIISIYKAYFNQRVLMLTHVKELIEQNYDKLITLWPQAPAGIYSAGLNKKDLHSRILFAGIASIAKKWDLLGKIDLIIVDECHLVSQAQQTTYHKLITFLTTVNPQLKVIGFTATPYRLGQGSIVGEGSIFTDICFDITNMVSFNRLIAEGYLAPLIPKHTKLQLDLSEVAVKGGEFVAGDLQHAVDKDSITEIALKETLELGQDRVAWLVFASGVEHACHIADMLNAMGIPSGVVHGGLSASERDGVIKSFKSGELRCVVNNNVLTTGFDHPLIDLIVVLRPTCSTGLWVQMLGRGTRPADGKTNCLVLDFAGNTSRLGPINDPVLPRKKGKKSGPAPVKVCPICNVYNHASARFCIGEKCSYEFTFETKIVTTASNKDIVKGDLPVVEVYKVKHLTYAKHEKIGGTPSLKVTYYTESGNFTDYVCMEHENAYIKKKGLRWWSERCDLPCPNEIDVALGLTGKLKIPTHIRVWVNKKYPEIIAYCYDGTAFNKEPAPEVVELPTTENILAHPTSPSRGYGKSNVEMGNILKTADSVITKADVDLENMVEVESNEDDLPF